MAALGSQTLEHTCRASFCLCPLDVVEESARFREPDSRQSIHRRSTRCLGASQGPTGGRDEVELTLNPSQKERAPELPSMGERKQ